jgi:hypothetical protein
MPGSFIETLFVSVDCDFYMEIGLDKRANFLTVAIG